MTQTQFIQTYNSLPENLRTEAEHYIEYLAKKVSIEAGQKNDQHPTKERGGYGILKDKIWMSDDFNAPLNDFKDYK